MAVTSRDPARRMSRKWTMKDRLDQASELVAPEPAALLPAPSG